MQQVAASAAERGSMSGSGLVSGQWRRLWSTGGGDRIRTESSTDGGHVSMVCDRCSVDLPQRVQKKRAMRKQLAIATGLLAIVLRHVSGSMIRIDDRRCIGARVGNVFCGYGVMECAVWRRLDKRGQVRLTAAVKLVGQQSLRNHRRECSHQDNQYPDPCAVSNSP